MSPRYLVNNSKSGAASRIVDHTHTQHIDRKSSLNRIKIINQARFFTNFDYKMSTKVLYVRIEYSMYDLICDVISCCVWSCDMGKINVYDKIVMQNKKKRENMAI